MRRPASSRAGSRRIFPLRTFASPRSVRRSDARRRLRLGLRHRGELGGVVIGLAVEGELTEPEPEELDTDGEAACTEGEVATVGWVSTSAETKDATLGRDTTPGSMSCVRRCFSARGEGRAAEVAPVEASDKGVLQGFGRSRGRVRMLSAHPAR
ncbi:hypothetical protein FB451DRAFT_1258865, partial [Mycena latifolia]